MRQPELLSSAAGQSAARQIDEMSRLYFVSRAIHVAAELGIADQLTENPVDIAVLAANTGTNQETLKRLLCFLSAYGIFKEHSPDQFCNTSLSSVLRDDHPQSTRANLRRIRSFWWSTVGELEHTIRTGEASFTHVHGMPFFQFLKGDPDIQKRFDEAMARISDSDDVAISSAYDFSRFNRIVDVGGGRGGLLVQILKRAPNATGILFEQPQVLERETRLDAAGLPDRANKVAGNFFESVPNGADCYVVKGVLHDFDDDQCIKILSNCRSAVDANGRIIIANQDLPTSIDGPHPNLTMDIQMMTLLGGRERSASQWSELFRESGLRTGDAVETEAGFTIIEGIPS